MFLKVTLECQHFFIIEAIGGDYAIRETDFHSLSQYLLGMRCRQPKAQMPLEILMPWRMTLTTSRVLTLKRINYVGTNS